MSGYVQSIHSGQANGTTVTCAFGSNVSQGNLIIVSNIMYGGFAPSNITSVTDSLGTSYGVVGTTIGPVNGRVLVHYAGITSAGGADIISVHATTNPNGIAILMTEVNGYGLTVTGSNVMSGTGTSVSSGSFSNNINDFIYGCFAQDASGTGGFTASGGFTRRENFNDTGPSTFATEDQIAGSGGTIAATGTFGSASNAWLMAGIAFQSSMIFGGEEDFSGMAPISIKNPTIGYW
jgi:hypothetical protein